MPPSRVASLVRDDPRVRAYDSRKGRTLAKSFEEYLRANLRPLTGWRDVSAFLVGCLYAKDVEVHARRDVWLHPEDFEKTLKGDCEDHALWAWVQLARLRWDVRFAVGILDGVGHAWLIVYREPRVFLIEATEKESGKILFEATSSARYEPVWSVDARLRFFLHAGAGRKSGS